MLQRTAWMPKRWFVLFGIIACMLLASPVSASDVVWEVPVNGDAFRIDARDGIQAFYVSFGTVRVSSAANPYDLTVEISISPISIPVSAKMNPNHDLIADSGEFSKLFDVAVTGHDGKWTEWQPGGAVLSSQPLLNGSETRVHHIAVALVLFDVEQIDAEAGGPVGASAGYASSDKLRVKELPADAFAIEVTVTVEDSLP